MYVFIYFTVNLMAPEMILVEGATCYKPLENVKCPDGKDSSCVVPCKKQCSSSTTGLCLNTPMPGLGRICVCSFIAPDCQKQHVCP